MSTDPIDLLAEDREANFTDELIAALELCLAKLDPDQIAAVLDDDDADHTRDQLAIIMGLDNAGVPEPLTTEAESSNIAAMLFVAAIIILASARVRYTINPGVPVILSAQAAARAVLDRYLADTGEALAIAISRAIYSVGTPEGRARQLIRSIGLTAKQSHSLEIMRTAMRQYLDTPRKLMPAHTDAAGRRVPAAYARNIDPGAILAPLRGHLSAAQRQMLRKALNNPKLTERDADRLLDKHATAMRHYRARVTAGEGVHLLTETAKLIGWQAAQSAGKLPATQRRFWRTAGDERVRHAHSLVPGMNRNGVPLNRPFATPLGSFMFPPLEIGCRCRAVLRNTP